MKKKLDIVYEDKYLIVVNKEAHLLTISSAKEKEKTLYHQVSLYLKKQNKNNKVFIVHRLDKDTSGLVIFAKSPKVKTLLQNDWPNVKRMYIALVHGVVKEKEILKSYLRETNTNLVYSSKSGKEAITEYERIAYNKMYSLVRITIKTGRKHQIRVQFNDINHPLVGDKIYSKIKPQKERLYLHAYYLEFTHPITKERIALDINYPHQFKI